MAEFFCIFFVNTLLFFAKIVYDNITYISVIERFKTYVLFIYKVKI